MSFVGLEFLTVQKDAHEVQVFRKDGDPDLFFNDVGFRVVVSLALSS